MVNSPYNTSATSRRSSRRSSSPPSDRTLSFFKNTSDNDLSYTSDTRSGRFVRYKTSTVKCYLIQPMFSRTDSSRSVSRDRSDSRSRSRSRSGSKSRSVSRSRSTSRSRVPRKAYSDKKLWVDEYNMILKLPFRYVRGYGSRSRSRSESRPR